MEICLACSCSTECKGSRRVLHNNRASHLVPVLRSFMQDRFLQEDIDNVLPSSAVSTKNYYVCIKCFRSLETYVKTKMAIEDDIVKVGEKLSMKSSQSVPPQVSTPVRKRRSDSPESLSKRQKIETPVRNIISRMCASDSPIMSVRVS